MAQMKYEDFVKFNKKQNQGQNQSKPRVGYFGLKEDGETAVVRFNLANLDDIRIVSKHTVKSAQGATRVISCLRTDPTQPLDVCPLCAAGEKVAYRAYIPLVYYEQDENNQTYAVPALWEQTPKIRETLKSFITDYPDLRDYLFKIVRHGKPRDTATTYTILPANPAIYKEDIFKKDFSGFDNLDFERFVATKTAEEMEIFLEEGDFPLNRNNAQPAPAKEEVSRPAPTTVTPRETTVAEQPAEDTPAPRPRRTYTY